ncbi:MAG: cytochrome-c peroxidase, partial [Candidatus Kapaibacterium sp.]
HNIADAYKFRTPPLRNVALSAPYMHDGRFKTLNEVMAFYKTGGRADVANKDPKIKPLNLNDQDISDIIEFLKTLTDERFTTNPAYRDPWQK